MTNAQSVEPPEDWPGNIGTPTDYLLDLARQGDVINLGQGNYAQEYRHGGEGNVTTGFLHVHPSKGQSDIPEGNPCAGSVPYDIPENLIEGTRWELHSRDPLHVEPSILCACGRHGYVRNGRWEELA